MNELTDKSEKMVMLEWIEFDWFADGLVDGFSVECNLQEMVVTVSTMVSFHGMVYPRGLTKQSPCMNEFDVPIGTDFVYKVPLRSCNTMNVDTVSLHHKNPPKNPSRNP